MSNIFQLKTQNGPTTSSKVVYVAVCAGNSMSCYLFFWQVIFFFTLISPRIPTHPFTLVLPPCFLSIYIYQQFSVCINYVNEVKRGRQPDQRLPIAPKEMERERTLKEVPAAHLWLPIQVLGEGEGRRSLFLFLSLLHIKRRTYLFNTQRSGCCSSKV